MRIRVNTKNERRPKIELSSVNTNYLRVMNPYMPLWWGMAMPGAGHIMVGKYLKGILLFIWEFGINTQANLNLSIYYSLTGQFDLAKDVLDVKWFFIYITVYIFNAWDAYRLTTDTNQFSMLAVRSNAKIRAFNLSFIEINYLQKLNVWVPFFWSLATPGLGHLIIRNILTGVYLIVWHVITMYKSNLVAGVYYTAIGDFSHAIAIMDIQWTLYVPSIYLFAACDCYYRSIEINQMFKMEQARYLQKAYTRTNFKLI